MEAHEVAVVGSVAQEVVAVGEAPGAEVGSVWAVATVPRKHNMVAIHQYRSRRRKKNTYGKLKAQEEFLIQPLHFIEFSGIMKC